MASKLCRIFSSRDGRYFALFSLKKSRPLNETKGVTEGGGRGVLNVRKKEHFPPIRCTVGPNETPLSPTINVWSPDDSRYASTVIVVLGR